MCEEIRKPVSDAIRQQAKQCSGRPETTTREGKAFDKLVSELQEFQEFQKRQQTHLFRLWKQQSIPFL